MTKYITRPVVIQAEQWTSNSPHKLKTDSRGETYKVYDCGVYEQTEGQLYDQGMRFVTPVTKKPVIDTKQRTVDVFENDFIILLEDGEHYPCNPDVFHKKYKPL